MKSNPRQILGEFDSNARQSNLNKIVGKSSAHSLLRSLHVARPARGGRRRLRGLIFRATAPFRLP
jgi:hypothetical protein